MFLDSVLVGIIAAIVGCFVGLAGWLSGRDKKISNDSEWKGTVNGKLDTIISLNSEVKEMKSDIKTLGEKLVSVDQSVKSAHKRIDDIKGSH